MTTIQPLRTKRRRDCSVCYGEARHTVLVDGRKTGLHVCCWCRKRVEDGRLEVRGARLMEPRRFRAKRGDES